MKDIDKNKMKHTIGYKMTVIIVAIMGLSLIAASIFSSFFLSKYYKKTKQDSIKKVYNELIKITQDDSDIENSDDVSILNNICEKAGATMIVVDSAGESIYDYGAGKMLADRWKDMIFGSNTKQKEEPKIIEKNDKYTIQSTVDRFSANQYYELSGGVSSGNYVVIRMSVESFRESIAIANKFYLGVGISLILVTTIIIIGITRKYTQPLLQLADISKRMSELDFNVKYADERDDEIGVLGESMNEMSDKLETAISELKSANLQLHKDIAKKEELSAKQKGFFQSREEMSERMNALDKEVYRLSEQKKKLEDNIEGQINYMWDEYEITLSDAAGLRNEEMNDLPAMKREISGLKDEIRKLGNVNVNAIEDYRNLMERYTFMKTQHDDLVEAEKTLEGIIEELDTAMRKQFTEKFAEISREFDKVFKELFGGGKGTLELMEDEDILEAGIRIIAQPPGKKLQNMMQLSGGEKALSAISLLFAIQNLKPSPFCLLDEIEAALDDSNVGRFAKYLHKLTKNTQFIVITHRRGTMEQVDRLYGITMQEKGVSTLVSVNLIDKDLDD